MAKTIEVLPTLSGLEKAAKWLERYEKSLDKKTNKIIDKLVENMVHVEGDTFTMGATSEQGSDAYGDEKPAHQVTLSSFSIGR